MCVCVCQALFQRVTHKGFGEANKSRGVWHSCPTTRNEAVGMSGKGNLASFLYLQDICDIPVAYQPSLRLLQVIRLFMCVAKIPVADSSLFRCHS